MAKTPEFERRDQLFDEALDLAPDRRASFLATACAGSPELRAAVESLLAHHEQAVERGFLNQPAASPLTPTSLGPRKEAAFGGDAPGTTLGPYTLKSQIGRGGFGTIYLAVRHDGQYQGRVAIKILKRGLDTDDILRRFLNERQTLAGLGKHPHIVTLLDGGSTPDGRPYFVMEYVDGKPIDKHCDDHQLSIAERLRLFLGVCAAVHFAHKNLVVHRDLKPANILVSAKDDQGRYGVKLLDFGIAKFLNPELSAQTLVPTAIRERLLTPEFASPEQIRGDAIDVTSDIYSLGVLLYQLLTGHHPYRFNPQRSNIQEVVCEQDPDKPSTKITQVEEVTTADGSMAKITPEYVGARRSAGPVKLRRQLAGDLDNIVLMAMRKDPEHRYSSVLELSRDLENYLEGNPVLARGNPLGYRTRKLLWKHKGKFSVAAVLFLAVTALAGWALDQRDKAVAAGENADQERRQAINAKDEATVKQVLAEKAEGKAREQWERAELGELLARRYWYLYDINQAYQAWDRADVTRALQLLNRQQAGPGKEDLRGFEWNYLRRLCHSELWTLPQRKRVLCVAIAMAGNTIAAAGEDGSIRLWRQQGAALQELPSLPGHTYAVNCLAFSPDGTTLVSASNDKTLKLWNVATGQEIRTLDGHKAGVLAVAFAPDGKKLVSGSADRTVNLWDVGGPQVPVTFAGHKASVRGVAFAPDGETVASGSMDGIIKLWDVNSKKQRGTFGDQPGAGVTAVAFSTDGQTLASASMDHTVTLWEIATGHKRARLQGHMAPVTCLAFSRAGRLATGSQDTTVRLWDAATGQPFSARKGHVAAVTSVAFTSDGATLASASEDKTIKIWDAVRAPEWTLLQGHTERIASFSISPDGRTLAAASLDKTVTLWDIATGQKRHTLKGHTAAIHSVAFSPDGNTLATGSADKTVKLWDRAAGNEIVTLRGHGSAVLSVSFAPDGKTLASGSLDQTVRLWDVANRQARDGLPHWQNLGIHAVAFSPDNRTLATASRDVLADGTVAGVVKLWDVNTRQSRPLPGATHTGRVSCLAFAANGKWLASGAEDKTVRVWDTTAENQPPAVYQHSDKVLGVAFAPDSKTLATASDEVKLWNLATAGQLVSLRGSVAPVCAVTFALGGATLISGDGDGTVRLWKSARD